MESFSDATMPAISRMIAVSYLLRNSRFGRVRIDAAIARRCEAFNSGNDFGGSLSPTDKNALKTLVYREMELLHEREEILEPYNGCLWKGDDDLSWHRCERIEDDLESLHKEMEGFGVIDYDKHPDLEDDPGFERHINGPTAYVEELRLIYEMAKSLENEGKEPWELYFPEISDLGQEMEVIPHTRTVTSKGEEDGYVKRVFNMTTNSFRIRQRKGMNFYDAVFLPAGRYSLGEMFVKEALEKLNVRHEEQYKIPECADINPLPFDFAVFKGGDLSFLIEFQGKQHYKPTTFGTRDKAKGQKIWETQVCHDAMKKKWCSDNNVPLLEIEYHDINKTSQIVEDYCRKMGVV